LCLGFLAFPAYGRGFYLAFLAPKLMILFWSVDSLKSALRACLWGIIVPAFLVAQVAHANPEITVYTGPANIGNERVSDASVYNFIPTAQGSSSATQTFTIENVGSTTLTISGVSLAGLDSSQFTLVSTSLSPTLESGGTTSFTVAFSPTQLRLKQARIEIISDDADESPYRIHLSGQGRNVQVRRVLAWDDRGGRNYRFNNVTDAVDLSAGGARSFALRSNGVVVDPDGMPAGPQGLTGVVAVDSSVWHDLALKGDGTVVAWGLNTRNPYNLVVTNQSVVPGGLNGVVAVSGGGAHSLALKSDGTVVAWGDSFYGQCTVPAGLNDAVAISAGGEHSLALKRDGTVVAWGGNPFDKAQTIVPTGLTGVTAIEAGYMDSLALKRDGTVVGWGKGFSSQPIANMINVVAISSGSSLKLNLRADGTLFSWGTGLVNGQPTYAVPSSLRNVVTMASGIFAFALGDFPEMAIYKGVSTAGQRLSHAQTLNLGVVRASAPSATQAFTIHNKGTGPLGISSITLGGVDAATFLLDASGVPASLAPGDTATFQLTITGIGAKSATVTVTTDDPGYASFMIPVTATGTSFVTVYKGTSTSGYPWKNDRGIHHFAPTDVLASSAAQTFTLKNAGTAPLAISSITVEGAQAADFSIGSFSATSVAPGASTTFTATFSPAQVGLRRTRIKIVSDDTREPDFFVPIVGRGVGRPSIASSVVVWGASSQGQTSVPPNLTEAVAIAAGENHTLALKTDGTVVAWGRNSYGQCTAPGGLSGVIALAAGAEHSLALKADGTVVAWGRNDKGQAIEPVGLSGVVAISAAGNTNAALKSNGSVIIWGDNTPLGGVPPQALSGVVSVAVGGSHVLALKHDGTVFAWGRYAEGQTTIPAGLDDAISITAGDISSTALRADGSFLLWGSQSSYSSAGMGAVQALDTGNDHTLALRADGRVFAWGEWDGANGRTTVPSGLVDVVAIAAGSNHNVALGRQIKPLTQTITFNTPARLYYGQTLKLTAWATSGLPVTFTVLEGAYTLPDDVLTAGAYGKVKIAAVQSGGGAYLPAPSVVRTITFSHVPGPVTNNALVLTLVNLNHTYDGTSKSVGLLGAGNAVPVITYNGAAEAPVNAGKYAVKATVASFGKTFSASGTLSIEKAPLHVRVADQRRFVSQANPALTFTYAGFRGTDPEAVIQKVPAIATTAKTTSPAGTYPITTTGGTASNYVFVHTPGSLVVDGFGLAYEALLSHEIYGRAAGKLEVTLNATCTSFSARVVHASDTGVVPFTGAMTVDPITGLASGSKTVTLSRGGITAPHSLQFTVTQDGTLNATYTVIIGAPWTLHSLPGHGRRLLPKPPKPLPYAGTHTFLMERPDSEPTLPATGGPPASGWAVATISASGVMTLTGILGDGTSFSTALNPDIAADPSYRLFLQAPKPVRFGTYLGGMLTLAGHYRFYDRKHIAEATLHWAKYPAPKDAIYPGGFDNLNVTAMLDPWLPPTKTISLVSWLGSAGDSMLLNMYPGLLGDWNVTLPFEHILSVPNKLVVAPPQANPHKWQTTLNAATGQLSGSLEAQEGPGKKRVIKFTGIMRQPTFVGDKLVGGGQFILPPPPGSPAGTKSTTSDMLIMLPEDSN
jgi:alpha-tubulin suppressor-like RCC1 family protein